MSWTPDVSPIKLLRSYLLMKFLDRFVDAVPKPEPDFLVKTNTHNLDQVYKLS